jgi:hypothetical protein
MCTVCVCEDVGVTGCVQYVFVGRQMRKETGARKYECKKQAAREH